MERLKIVLDGETVLRSIPQSTEEVTLNQYVEICGANGTEGDPTMIVTAIMVNIEVDRIKGVREKDYKNMAAYLYWMRPNLLEEITTAKLKSKVNFMGSPCKYPKTIEEITIGQKLYMDGLIRRAGEEKKMNYSVFADIVAVFMMPSIIGRYDEDYLEEFKEMVLKEPAVNTVPLALFFLRGYNLLTLNGILYSVVKGVKKNLGQKLRRWISSGIFRYFTRSRKET